MTQDDYAERVEELARDGGDRELAEFRGLMEVPSTFDEGFTWPSFIGVVFVALVMVPGALYMSLVAGVTIGPAAQWVTVILFIEVARRANKVLKRAEIFILFYLSAAAMTGAMGIGLLWNQFYAQSVAAQASGIAELLPQWYAPTEGDVLMLRTIFHPAWLPAIGLMIFATIMGRLNNTILGYGLFRLASDVEKLPFPLAPLGAQGVLALSEEQEEENPNRDASQPLDPQKKWRWRVFSIGTVIGMCFGAVYIGLPTITGALLEKPIILLPIPFADWTPKTGEYLPAVATGMSLDFGLVILGMVLPFYAVLGGAICVVSMFIVNPLLYRADILHTWNTGDDILATTFKNSVDFHFSFGLGAALAIALIGIGAMVLMLVRLRRQRTHAVDETPREPFAIPEGRGDIKFKLIVAVYIVSTVIYILVSGWLIQWHEGVMAVMIFYGFIYTPLISYATARLEGLAGQAVNVPMIREASFILSGYRGVAVWFLPVPLHNYGMQTVMYRQAELTGTRFTSIWKSELVLAPIIILSTILFANFIWGLAPVPGPQYPFAQRMWELYAEQQAVIHSATLGGYSVFEQALNFKYIGIGLGVGLLLFGVTKGFGLPTFLVYGIFNGLGAQLYSVVPTMIGALLGRYYFQRRLGLLWRQYIPVVAAGYACGVGLIGTFTVGITFLTKSVFQLPF